MVSNLRALGAKLQHVGTEHPRILLATRHLTSTANFGKVAKWWNVIRVDQLDWADSDLTIARVFQLTQFRTVVVLDPNVSVRRNVDEMLDIPTPAAVGCGSRTDALTVEEIAANAAAQRYVPGVYIVRPSLALMKFVCGNLRAVHGYGAHALIAAFLASTPTTHKVHGKYNMDVGEFELIGPNRDVAIVSGYKYSGSRARSEWLDDRGLASGYWNEKCGEAILVSEAPESGYRCTSAAENEEGDHADGTIIDANDNSAIADELGTEGPIGAQASEGFRVGQEVVLPVFHG